VVIQEDFERPVYQLPKSTWQARQGKRWKIAGGVLSGIPSSAEYRSKNSPPQPRTTTQHPRDTT
jgi:hypothetical protein